MMNAIPMLGSLGSIVLVATMARPGGGGGGRSFIAAGMFLFATLGFIVVQIDRQRKQRNQQVTGSRTEYLRYLATVRRVARDAADQQRRALTWHHPDPASLPALAEERSRIWEHSATDAQFLQVRYGLCAQPLALDLVPPESAPIDQVDPAAASALHRLLVVHRLQPDLPASIDLRAFDRIEVCGAEDRARALARAIICSAAAFHSPANLVVAVLSRDEHLAHWDWVKWLPHVQSQECSDAVGPMRMVTTSLTELSSLLPPDLSDRPRFGADERPASPHILLVTDGVELPPGNHVIPPDGLHGVTLLDLPSRWPELEDPTRLRIQLSDERADPHGRVPVRALRLREEPIHAKADQCDLATAEAFARRLTPLHTVAASGGEPTSTGEIAGPSDFMDLLGLGEVAVLRPLGGLASPAGPRPAAGADRARRGRRPGPPRHQGVRPAGHGPPRAGDRRDRLRQVGVPAHAGARPGHDALARTAQHGAGRLQGRRDVRRHVRTDPRLRGDHQPRQRAHPGRPDAGRAVRRDGAATGVAARGRQLRLDPGLREGPARPARIWSRCRRC